MKKSPKRLNVISLELNILRISIFMILLLVLPVRDNYGNGYGKDRTDFLTSFLDAENAPKFCSDMMNIANDDSISVSVRDTIQLISPSELSFEFQRIIPELSWENILKAMKYEYKPVDDILLNEEFDFCRPYSIALHNSMQSTDKEFIVWIEHYFTSINPVIKDTSIPLDSVIQAYNDDYKNVMKLIVGGINNYITRFPFELRNTHYNSIIRDHLIDIAGKFKKKDRINLTIDDLKKHVEYMYGENVQNPFNADTVIRYSLPVKPVNGDKSFTKKYAYCEVLLLQKNDIGPVVFYCFYTKAGYKKRNDYFSKLEQTFSFNQ